MRRQTFPHQCEIKRDVALGTNGRRQKQTLATDVECLIVPMPARTEVENQWSVGSGYDVYFPGATTDVKSGDQIIWEGDTYNVRAARPYAVPRVGHTHVLAQKADA